MKRAPAVLVLILAAMVGGVLAQGLTPRAYMPAVFYGGTAPTPTPVVTTTPVSHGAVWVGDVLMPFNVFGGVEPIAVQDSTGAWFVSVFRIDGGGQTGAWVVTFRLGDTVAQPIGQVGDAPPEVALQDTALSNSRGSLAPSWDRQRLYSIEWQDKAGGSRRPRLRIHQILDYVP